MGCKRTGYFSKHCVVYTVLTALFLFVYNAFGYPRDYRFTDMHLHYVNFVLETQGFENLFDEMNRKEARIERAIVFGLGYALSWPDIRPDRVTYYTDSITYTDNTPPLYFNKEGDYKLLRDYSRLPEEQKKRIYPFLQGIDVMDRNEIYYVQEMFKNYPELCGIGELLMRKGLMNNVTCLVPEGNSYAMAPVFDFAAANNLPVIFHQNIADEIPSSPDDQDQIYMKEISDILFRHPRTTFIWAHTGISRYLRVKNHIQVLERLLTAHPNLYFDISWFVWDAYIEGDKKSWAELIIKFPDRFMLGSDKIGNFKADSDPKYTQKNAVEVRFVMSSKTQSTGVSDEIKKYIPLLELIDSMPGGGTEVSDKLAFKNIDKILDSCGCKQGRSLIIPWGDRDPWKESLYSLPTAVMEVNNGNPIPMAVTSAYKNLENTIADKYYRWDRKYDYTGMIKELTIPIQAPYCKKQGVIVFNDPNFKKYTGILEESTNVPFSAASLILVENWEEFFSYKNGNKLFPNGNWPTLPWWQSDSSEGETIDKVMVPDGKVLVLYDDEYFRGKEIGRIRSTHGAYFSLEKYSKQIKSFQFIPGTNSPACVSRKKI